VKPTKDDLKRYADNYLREQDGIALYRALAKAEQDPARIEIFEKLAKAEERHATRWARLLKNNGAAIPAYSPGWRVLTLGWLSRRFGTQHILPVVTGLESRDQDVYRGQTEAAGLPAEERSHFCEPFESLGKRNCSSPQRDRSQDIGRESDTGTGSHRGGRVLGLRSRSDRHST